MAQIKDRAERNFRCVDKQMSLDARAINANMFNKIKVGGKSLANDVALLSEYFETTRTKKYTKADVDRAIDRKDLEALRKISDYYYNKSGIYERLCKYMAAMFRYDFFVTPVIQDTKIPDKKVIEGWYKSCLLLEGCDIKKQFTQIALKVIKNGCFYGYKLVQKTGVFLQELPIKYCRSRYSWNGKPAVEFNVKFFDDYFNDSEYRMRVIKMFPKEIQKAYVAYKKGNLPKDTTQDDTGWVLLDPKMTVKFSCGDSDVPMFVNVVPHLIDLQDAQDIDNKKMLQQITKIIIQKFPLDKNNDLVFDLSEMQAFHNMATSMVGDTIGVDVLSTLADVEVADMSDKGNVSAVDQLNKVERTVFNEAGVSQLQFNSDGSVALEKSIINDESSMLELIYEFQEYLNSLLDPFNKSPRRLFYQVDILPTTGYNYQNLAKLYKEQTMMGFSKLMPQVALGQKQSTIIATAIFENKIMKLDQVFVAPELSSTRSKEDTKSADKTTNGNGEDANIKEKSGSQGGRPELEDSEKSEKTIRNKEAQQ